MAELSEVPVIDKEQLALLHDIYAVTHQVLTQKCTFHFEEFEFINKVVNFHKENMLQIRKQLEDLEPKKDVESGKAPVSEF